MQLPSNYDFTHPSLCFLLFLSCSAITCNGSDRNRTAVDADRASGSSSSNGRFEQLATRHVKWEKCEINFYVCLHLKQSTKVTESEKVRVRQIDREKEREN